MSLGKLVRLGRLFSHPSGRLCSVAVDHFIGYGAGLPPGLRQIKPTLAAIVAGRPDAVTMHKGIAASAWGPYAGRVPMILQSTTARPDDTACEQIADPLDAVRLGADAFAVAIFLRGDTEAEHLRVAAECVQEAAEYEMPVICHAYPRRMSDHSISLRPRTSPGRSAARWRRARTWSKRRIAAMSRRLPQIVADSPVPVVAAGGPKAKTLREALEMMANIVRAAPAGRPSAGTFGALIRSRPRFRPSRR